MIDASQLIRPDEPFVLRQRRPDLADDDAFLRFARGLEFIGTTDSRPAKPRHVVDVRDRQGVHAPGRLDRVAGCHQIEVTEPHRTGPFVAGVVRLVDALSELRVLGHQRPGAVPSRVRAQDAQPVHRTVVVGLPQQAQPLAVVVFVQVMCG